METLNTTFNYKNPPIVAMIQCRTAEECIEKIKSSIVSGAEAIGVQLCQLKTEERTKEKLNSIFLACDGKPIYVTSYRLNQSEGLSDDECAELLLLAAECGASLCDIPGDFFQMNDSQITTDKSAVAKQKLLIEKIHSLNSQVLISTHDKREMSAEEIYNLAKIQSDNGADVLKIVVKSDRKSILSEYISVIQRVNYEINKPFLLLDSGACKNVLRKVGGFLGNCMYLCVDSYNEFDTKEQPLIKNIKKIRENILEEIK